MKTNQKAVERLLQMRTRVDAGKKRLAELDGERNATLRRLQEDFGCKDVQQGRKMLAGLEKDLAFKEAELDAGVKALEKDYDWES
jgi:hypothetical protein